MAYVQFWKLPAAQYNAQEHGNGIFQCSDDPTNVYLFGRPCRIGITPSGNVSKLLSPEFNRISRFEGFNLISGSLDVTNSTSNDDSLIFMDDISNSKLRPEVRELLPDFLKSLYQQQALDNGILYICTLDNKNESIAVCQFGEPGGTTMNSKAIFLMDSDGNQYFNKVTGDSFHLKTTPTTPLNDLADTDIPCAKQVKEASLIDPTLPSPYIESFDTNARTYNLAVDDGTVPDQWVLKIAGRANRAQASNSFVLTEEEYQLLQDGGIQMRPVQLMITKNGKYSLPSNIQFGGGALSKDLFPGVFLLDENGNVLDKNADSYPAGTIKAYGFKAGDGNYYAVDTEAIPNKLAWGGLGKLIEPLPQITSAGEAIKDYNGEYNTTEIITQLKDYNDGYTTGAPAAEACRARIFNGKQGFLPSFGQFYDFYSHKSEVDSLATKFSLDAFPTDTYHWTSTQYSAGSSWILYWNNGYRNGGSRYNQRHVRAFFAL